ncbi:uncharacterized protein LOC132285842 [Cornus florida]|uniref:uncharacterized protein LOC132285842 n=1 Tax=Cornus florida TaxID=4283 RepID=UPI00289781C4|nr:uncharacterized protein LOC132285842 [Cornus florida]
MSLSLFSLSWDEILGQLHMASIVANLPPALLVNDRQTFLRTLRKFPISPVGVRQRHVAVVAKAGGETSDSSPIRTFIKGALDYLDKSDDPHALIKVIIGLGAAAVLALLASMNPIIATHKHFFIQIVKGIITMFPTETGGSSDSSTSPAKYVQNVWTNFGARFALNGLGFALNGLGFAAVAALGAVTNLITEIDKLPLIPSVFELVGILFSSWFIYRYLLFKHAREELFQTGKKFISDILGQ